MTKKQKKLIGIISAIALCLGIIPAADAMHIMEGFIAPGYCILWGVLSLPFLVMGFMSIKKKKLQSIAELLFCLQFPAHSYL